MPQNIQHGLKQNWQQFALLVLVNAFVGGMVGMERAIFPEFASSYFGITSATAIMSFIAAFGVSKAIANLLMGRMSTRFTRKQLLLLGWVFALPVPFLLLYAQTWNWVIFANVLLGLNQGFAWSSTVVMKMDLVGQKERGLAMGLNEFAGYLAVGLVAFFTGYLANTYGIKPYPFYLGIGMSLLGLGLTCFFVRDTGAFVIKEQNTAPQTKVAGVFWATTLHNKTLSSVTQAGLVNNLNDGMIWGTLPLLLLGLQYSGKEIGMIAAAYPVVWGVAQLVTGRLSDLMSKKRLLVGGMILQGLAILMYPFCVSFGALMTLSILLGLGTACVYPTFLSTIAEVAAPNQRAETVGAFRFWRDLGYAVGAITAGVVADLIGLHWVFYVIGLVTVASGLVILFRMPELKPIADPCIEPDVLRCKTTNAPLQYQLIDVRTETEYQVAHIDGIRLIPIDILPQSIAQLQKHVEYVMVCQKGGGRSKQAAEMLQNLGFRARWLCGGTEKWLNTSCA
jgi:MFS family permease